VGAEREVSVLGLLDRLDFYLGNLLPRHAANGFVDRLSKEEREPLRLNLERIISAGKPHDCSAAIHHAADFAGRMKVALKAGENVLDDWWSKEALRARMSLELEVARQQKLALKVKAAVESRTRAKSAHACNTLDERAVALLKRWQKDESRRDRWSIDELAKELGTYRQNLTGKRKGAPRCPVFFDLWASLGQLRKERRMERRSQSSPSLPRCR
jgi:hypothetical protein